MATEAPPPPGLYLVATPIGHLRDISLRALDVLAAADLVACEDTRHSRRLLDRHGLTARTLSYHAHNERRQLSRLLAALADGGRVALVSDAGTPGISDPGLLLVRAAREAGIPVHPVPGPSAVTAALAAAGLPQVPFTFAGFLPPRAGARRRALQELAGLTHTLVLFEAPHRLAAALADMAAVLGPRPAALCRELTKLHEEIRHGTLAELAGQVGARPVKGEITLVIGPPGDEAVADRAAGDEALAAAWRQALADAGGDRRRALRRLAAERGLSRSALYRALAAAGVAEAPGS